MLEILVFITAYIGVGISFSERFGKNKAKKKQVALLVGWPYFLALWIKEWIHES